MKKLTTAYTLILFYWDFLYLQHSRRPDLKKKNRKSVPCLIPLMQWRQKQITMPILICLQRNLPSSEQMQLKSGIKSIYGLGKTLL